MKIKNLSLLLLVTLFLASCSPAPAGPSETEIAALIQLEVSKMQTAMPSPTPASTPTNALPPTPAAPPTAIGPDPVITQAEKSDGTFLVGSEIAPGKWVSRGFKNCMGFLLDKDGNSVDTAMGQDAILFVTDKGYSVKFINPVCKWTYLPE